MAWLPLAVLGGRSPSHRVRGMPVACVASSEGWASWPPPPLAADPVGIGGRDLALSRSWLALGPARGGRLACCGMRRLVPLVCCLALVACSRLGGEPFQQSHNDVVALTDAAEVGQTFTVPDAVVTRVELLVATFGEVADGRLVVTVSDSESWLGRGEIEGADLADNGWVGIELDPPVPVQGTALLEVARDGVAPVGVYADRPPADVTPAAVADDEVLLNDPYAGGTLVLDGESQPGDLAFRVAGSGSAVGLTGAIAGDAGRGAARTPLALAAWLAVLAALSVAAVLGLRRPRAD